MKPEQTACTSKAAPRVMPSRACTVVAVAGKVSSGVVVAQTIRSSSPASMPASRSAARAASSARSEVFSPSARDMALADAGALADPFVGGVDALGEIVVGDDVVRQIRAAADDAGRGSRSGRLPVPALGVRCRARSATMRALMSARTMSMATSRALAKPSASVPPWLFTTTPFRPEEHAAIERRADRACGAARSARRWR